VRAATKVLAAWTFFVVVAGGIVTSTGSGLADRHWPTFDGSVLPSPRAMLEDRGKLFEHGHRIVAGSAVVFTWTLALVLGCLPRAGVGAARRLALAAAVVGPVPAVLGGLTVLFELPPALSIVHVAAAMAFLGLYTALAVVAGKRWGAAAEEALGAGLQGGDARWLAAAGVGLAAAIYTQIILGAVPRHAGIGVAPHILWAFAVITLVILVVGRVFGRHARLPGVLHPGVVLLALGGVQFFLGFAAFLSLPSRAGEARTVLSQVLASTHQAVGALMLAAAVVFLVRSLGLRALGVPSIAPPLGVPAGGVGA
jgi:heme A synthase